jgi:DHA1 family inner membrane transport protein
MDQAVNGSASGVGENAPWAQILLIYAIGVCAMLVVSIAVPSLGGIGAEFRPKSTATIGWVMSIPALAAALTSLAVGGVVDRYGDRPLIVAGTVLVVAGDVGVVTAGSLDLLLAWRVVSGLGYVAMAVAAVTMISRLTTGRQRVTALALWSTVIPASFIVASLYGATQAAGTGWRMGFIGHAAATTVLVLLGWLVLPTTTAASGGNRLSGLREVVRTPWPFLLGLSFAGAAALQTGFVSTLPAMLSARLGVSEGEIHSFNLAAMACNVAGAFLFGLLCNRGARPLGIGLGAVVTCGAAGIGLIVAPSGLGAALAMDCVMMLALGLLVGMWALLPAVSPSPAAIGATSGLITQVTLLGVLFGPPMAFAGLHFGTHGSLLFVAAGLALCIGGALSWRRGAPAGAPVAH